MKAAGFMLSSIPFIIQQYADFYQEEDKRETLKELECQLGLPKIQTFDFIIVGAGTAGCVLAGRLSEHYSILLLEAGGDPVPTVPNAYLSTHHFTHPAINTEWTSVKQENFSLGTEGLVKVHTGRMMGGSGSHNGNNYYRGSPNDWNYYAEVTDDPSWRYENMVEHFKRFESFHGPLVNETERDEYYATTGPFHVEMNWTPLTERWFSAGEELGYKRGDPNGFQREGFTAVAKSTKNGERVSTYSAYIKPVKDQRIGGLRILKFSNAQKILLDEENKAYGVTYLRHGIPQIAHATKEVIVSSGAIQSPLLLMKSGIGRRETLENAKVPVKVDVPGVGENFMDQPTVTLKFFVKKPNVTLFPRLEEKEIETQLSKFHETPRSGWFTESASGLQAYIVSSRAKRDGESDWPNMQLIFSQNRIIGKDGKQYVHIDPVLTRPRSKGKITLDTTAYLEGMKNDSDLAIIDYRSLTDPSDIEVLLEGIRIAMKVAKETTTFREMELEYDDTNGPEACAKLPFGSDEYWKCFIQHSSWSYHHFAGTCKMGVLEKDPMAVVDSQLRVRGTGNLRVIDASVLPQPINANLNGAVIALAEKSVQSILNRWEPL